MAQVDSGLGWSANSSYLVQTTVPFGKIVGMVSDDPTWQPLPEISDGNLVKTNGVLVGKDINGGMETRAAAAVGQYLFIAYVLSNKHFYVFGPKVTGTPNRGWVGFRYYLNMWSINQMVFNNTITGTDIAYSDTNLGDWTDFNPMNCPSFSTEQDALSYATAHLHILNYEFSKSVPGSAVIAFLKYYNKSSNLILSPVVISSEEEFTELDSNPPATFSESISTHFDQGFHFKMRIIHGLDGAVSDATVPFYDLSEPIGGAIVTYSTDQIFGMLSGRVYANILITETIDPYDIFGHTKEDGGEPDPDPEDDDIEGSELPTTSFADAGFCRIYNPDITQLNALANYMWTDQTFLQTVINHLKQILENPIDAIISLSIVPCIPEVSSSEEVKVMYIPTGVYMPPVTKQFVPVDCGTYTLKEMYGSALDYNPYTTVQLYLPYIGIVQLDTDEVMGKTLQVGYNIDVVSGVCCAYVKANNDILYQFSGHCSIQQPITSADFSGYVSAAMAAGKLVASIAAAGAGAPAVAATLVGASTPSISGTTSDTRITERNENTGRQITAGTRHRESKTENPGASFGEVATRGISNTVGAVMNSKTIVQHSGGFSGNSGYLAKERRPYLIITHPNIANPENYGQYNGRPCMMYLNLGDCVGYTQVQSIHLTGINATNPELSELATLLMSGVIL